ncbi:alpha/beta fold hydrolase [Streptomyces sp. NPDC004111]|uniref:alpha/beta fold hydrolase n=1 Tax=Streptomyces sp. NPDC004111 TaxID=3364690 RepID=UPI0036B71ADA
MTHFLLVHGGYTGSWIWRDTLRALRRHGHDADALTLTGLGDRRHLATPATNLSTHTEDVVQVIDHLDSPDCVLVGHSYGAHPAFGAALRRPGRVSRLVLLDAPVPTEGESVLDQIPDPAWRERILRRAADHDGWRLPVPDLTDTLLWGSFDGVGDEALKRLEQFAAPQPLATLAQPAHWTAGDTGDPTTPPALPPLTGILCTRQGRVSIAAIEALVASGDPRFQELADPDTAFFELASGHYPMLSGPDELAVLLVRAAAGEGHRITPGPTRT